MRRHRLAKACRFRCMLGLAASCLLVALGLYINQVISDRRAAAKAAHDVALANAGQPSPAPATIKPSAKAIVGYNVPADQPRYLLIPKLDVKARVLPVGLTKAGAIGSPSNVHDTAWYNGSSLPGKAGATLIDGHVSSWTTHGVFYDLKLLQTGDQLQVQLGSNQVLNYRVVKTQTYDAAVVPVNELLSPIDHSKSGLNLITCAGDIIKGSNDFNKRIVVYAALSK